MAKARRPASQGNVAPPCSPEAEQSVIGAILLRPSVLDEVADLITTGDFYREAHGRIFRAMMELHLKNEPVDLATVAMLLRERGQLEEVGGPLFLTGLSEHVGIASNAPYYAKIVRDKAMLRQILAATQEIAGICSTPETEPADLLDFADSRFSEVRSLYSGNGFRSSFDIDKAIPDISEFLKTEIPLRAIYLDPWLKESSINLISGWRGVGKTGFALGLLSAISRGEDFGPWQATTGIPSLYFDAEMALQDTMERCQSFYGGENQNLFIYSDHFCSFLGMPAANLLDEKWRAWVKNEVLLKRGVKLWVLDNIGAVTPGLDENSREGWSPINRWLLDLRFAGISTILIDHEGKSGEQRGTSAREDSLDIPISLKRPKDYHPEDGALFICRFEKARIRQTDLHLISEVEFKLDTDPEGKAVWTFASLKQENKVKVLKLFDEGMSAKDIAASLGITAARVSQIKKEAVREGLITEVGKLTQTGFKWLQNT